TPGRTDQAPGWIRLQPALALAAVPDPVLGTQHPPPALVVEHGEIAHSDPEGARLEISGAPLFGQEPVSDLGFGEWVDRHAREYGSHERVESNRLKGPQHASHHLPKLKPNRRPSRFVFTFQTEQARRASASERASGQGNRRRPADARRAARTAGDRKQRGVDPGR